MSASVYVKSGSCNAVPIVPVVEVPAVTVSGTLLVDLSESVSTLIFVTVPPVAVIDPSSTYLTTTIPEPPAPDVSGAVP